jgi:acyl-CoA synthetase (NDP forming)
MWQFSKSPYFWDAKSKNQVNVAFNQTNYHFSHMNLHEYQGKELLKSYGVKIQEGIVAYSAEEAVAAAKKMKGTCRRSWQRRRCQIGQKP